ncbi:MAG: 4'-phosphopantetheinyl transferase superfamily protein [Pseudomonadota bacterium]
MNGGGDGFLQRVRTALERAGAVPLEVREACVAVFDTRVWAGDGEAVLNGLDQDERARAARFRFEADRDAYVLSHALWRAVLQACLGPRPGSPGPVRLARHPSGQPWLPDHPGWATSLSRSGPFAAVAVAHAGWIGVDLERFPPRQPLDELVAAIATPAERGAVWQHTGPDRERALLRLWSGKEAVLKAWGTGLTLDPTRVDTLRCPVRHPGGEGDPCDLQILVLPPDLVGVLAVPPGLARIRQLLPETLGGQSVANSCDK